MPDPTLDLSESLNNWLDSGKLQAVNSNNLWLESGSLFEYGDPIWTEDITFSGSTLVVFINETIDNFSDSLRLVYEYIWRPTETINSFADDFATPAIPTSLTLSDSTTLNWIDSIAFGHGISVFEDLNSWQDSLNSFINSILAAISLELQDNSSLWADDLGFGYGLLITDDLNNWLDLYEPLFPHTLAVADDNSANWADVLVPVISYEVPLTDDLNNWDDALDSFMDLGVAFSDSTLNMWLDYIAIGYGIILSDDGNNLTELLNLGQELVITDDLNSWADDITSTMAESILFVSASDSLNNFDDAYSHIYGYLWQPNENNADNWLDYFISDILSLSDDINFWLDGISFTNHYQLQLEDNLNAPWGDDIFSFLISLFPEAQVADDRYYRRYLNDLPNIDLMSDILGIISLQLRDDELNNWQDGIGNEVVEVVFPISLATDDDLNNWSDAATLLYNYLYDTNDDLNVMVDTLSGLMDYLYETSDDLNNWQDQIDFLYNLALEASDDLNNWLDEILFAMVIELAVADDNSANWAEAIAFIYSYEEGLSDDNSGNWNDELASLYHYGLVLEDDGSMNWGN